jgi:replicative DNA helicase
MGNFLEVSGSRVTRSTLLELLDYPGFPENVEAYSVIILDKFKRRTLIKTANNLIKDAHEKANINEFLGAAMGSIFELANDPATTHIERLGENAQSFISRVERTIKDGVTPGLPSPWREINRLISSFRNSEVTVVCGRPGMGKSSWAFNVATYLAIDKSRPVGIFSLEMSRSNLIERLASQISQVDSQKIRDGAVSGEEWEAVVEATKKIQKAPIYVDDYPVLDEISLLSKARLLRHQHKIEFLVIDYVQLMRGRGHNREMEVRSCVEAARRCARELEIPVLAVAQLSRETERRADHRPQLSDLRESGSFENDADVVIGLYRDEYYNDKSEHIGEAEVIVLKARNGPTGTVRLGFRKSLTTFYSLQHGNQ